MSNVVWIKQRQVIAIHPISPCASVEVKRINVTGQWETAASDWLHSGLFMNVQSCIVFARACVNFKGIYLQSHSTAGDTPDEYKPVCGGFQHTGVFSNNCWSGKFSFFWPALGLLSAPYEVRKLFSFHYAYSHCLPQCALISVHFFRFGVWQPYTTVIP